MKETSMSAIIKELTIAATPGRVFQSLTQQNEIARWWTSDLSIRPEVGTLAEFRFYRWGAGSLQFEIAELDADKNISWISRQGPPGWAGTIVTWQLMPARDGTQLVFVHDGFPRADELYKHTRENWEYFLVSLKSYLETGQGTPGAPPYIR
jgi:uncharacterized protein YndB with AHSA1/START domain